MRWMARESTRTAPTRPHARRTGKEAPSACQPKGNRAGLLGTFDDHGFPACDAIDAGPADDRRDLARRRRVQELRRDLTSREENVMAQVASGGVRVVNAQTPASWPTFLRFAS